jgi:hypothetical protein
MAKQTINVGSSSNDATGDTLRGGAIKINSNFTELYQNNDSVFTRLLAGSHITLSKVGNNCTINAIVTPYVLPTASTSTIGGVKVDGSSITVNGSGVISTSVYSLPTASTSTIGGVKVDGTTVTISNGIISAAAAYSLPTASQSEKGGVRVDGSSILINNSGVISSVYTLPIASTTALGGVKVDGSSVTISNGIISAASAYLLPVASTTELGGVKVDNTTITISNGIISAAAAYSLPIATTTELGGVKVDGTSIIINGSGVITSTLASSRTPVSNTTTVIFPGSTVNLTIVGYKGYALYKVETFSSAGSGGAWVRIYTNSASRTSDASRLQTSDPSIQGILAEVITITNATVPITPGVFGFSDEAVPTSNIQLAVTNTSQVPCTITVTLTLLPLEI